MQVISETYVRDDLEIRGHTPLVDSFFYFSSILDKLFVISTSLFFCTKNLKQLLINRRLLHFYVQIYIFCCWSLFSFYAIYTFCCHI